jgi:STE24 endopeptidase
VNEDKATRYHRLRRGASALSIAWSGGLLVALILTGGSVMLRDIATRAAAGLGSPRWLTPPTIVAVYVLLLTALHEVGSLPAAFYQGFVLERRYGLATEKKRHWLADHAKASGLGLGFGVAGAVFIYALLRWSPAWWWLGAAAGCSLVAIGLTIAGPVVLLPMFYHSKPLDREPLRARLVSLAGRVGVPVVDAYEWRLSDRTRRANAALAGLGATRRILVSDTLLADYSDDEIEVILAHELAHHAYHDIWNGIGFEAVLMLAGFFAGGSVLARLAPAAGLRDSADVAGLPLVALGVLGVSLAGVPVANALSRALERRADRLALDLTRNPASFATAMRRLAAQNLAEERPSGLARWLFYSHPPVAERIDMALRWTGTAGRG